MKLNIASEVVKIVSVVGLGLVTLFIGWLAIGGNEVVDGYNYKYKPVYLSSEGSPSKVFEDGTISLQPTTSTRTHQNTLTESEIQPQSNINVRLVQ